MPTIVYDTGALLAAERRNPDFLALHDELTAARIRPIVPVVVLAQAWRGGPQHQTSRVLKGCDILPDDQHIGRAAARELVADYEQTHGPLPTASRQRARQFLAEVGLLDDDEPQQAAG